MLTLKVRSQWVKVNLKGDKDKKNIIVNYLKYFIKEIEVIQLS